MYQLTYPTIKKIKASQLRREIMKLQYREATLPTVGMECQDWSSAAFISYIPSFAQVTPEDYELHKSQILFHGKKHGGRMQRKGDHPGYCNHRVRKSKLKAFFVSATVESLQQPLSVQGVLILVALVSWTGFACWMRAFPRRTQFQKLWCRTSWGKLQR